MERFIVLERVFVGIEEIGVPWNIDAWQKLVTGTSVLYLDV
jgi:hypothetical protein